MRQRGLRQVDLARRLGLAPEKVSKAFAGVRRFSFEEMDSIRSWLADPTETPALRPIPVIGQIAAGNWREAVHQPIGSMPAPDPSIPPKAFALRVDGDSMDKLVEDGGTVIIDPDDRKLFPGRYYAVKNGEGETTFKQFAADPARLVPCSTNDQHRDIEIGSGEGFEVIGRVIWRASRM